MTYISLLQQSALLGHARQSEVKFEGKHLNLSAYILLTEK